MAIGTVGALVGGSLIGGAVSAKSASKAADAQTQAADQANATQRYIFDRSVDLTEPQREAGGNALAALMGMAGIGDGPSFGSGGHQIFKRKTKGGDFEVYNDAGRVLKTYDNRAGAQQHLDDRRVNFLNDPGYQFRLDEGQKAISRRAAANGMSLSGATLKAGADYASGLASQEFGNAFNRLAGIAGIGQTATQQQIGAGQNYAGAVGQNALAAGNARASGYINQGNALNSTIGDISGLMTLNQMGVFG